MIIQIKKHIQAVACGYAHIIKQKGSNCATNTINFIARIVKNVFL